MKHEGTLEATRACAASWERGVRLLGNVEAGAIVDAIDWVLAELADLRSDLRSAERDAREAESERLALERELADLRDI